MNPKDIQTGISHNKFHDFSMIFHHFSNSMIFPCMEFFLAIFHVFQWEPCPAEYTPQMEIGPVYESQILSQGVNWQTLQYN